MSYLHDFKDAAIAKQEQDFMDFCQQEDAMIEERMLSRNIPISKLPETDQEIRIRERKED